MLSHSALAIHGALDASTRLRTRDGTRSSLETTPRRSARISAPLPPVQRRDGQSSALQGREMNFLHKKQKSLPKVTPRKALARNACDSASYRCGLPSRRLPGVLSCLSESNLPRTISVPRLWFRKRTRSIHDPQLGCQEVLKTTFDQPASRRSNAAYASGADSSDSRCETNSANGNRAAPTSANARSR